MVIPEYIDLSVNFTSSRVENTVANLRAFIQAPHHHWILISPYSAGDCYQHLTLLEGFKKYHCGSGEGITFVTSPNFDEICQMFTGVARFVYYENLSSLDGLWRAIAETQSFAPGQIIPLGVDHFGDGHLARFAFLRGIASLDLIKYGLSLPFDLPPSKPRLTPELIRRGEQAALKHKIVPGRSVLLIPHSRSFHPVDPGLWESLAEKLQAAGYSVFSDVTTGCPLVTGTLPVCFSLGELPTIAKKAGHVVAVRSGISDILSGFPGINNVTIFPGTGAYKYTQAKWPYSFSSTLERFHKTCSFTEVGDAGRVRE